MRVFLFRGLAGKFFSTGLDNLAEKLGAAGHTVSIHSWIERTAVEADTISQAKSGKIPTPIAIAGHSLGGNSANYMARNLAAAGVPVTYVATIDPTEPEPAPVGVRCDNFRSRDFRAEKVEGATDHLREDLNHIEIDKDDAVHRQILDACNAVPAVLMSTTQSVNAADGEVAMLMEKLGLNKQTGGTASELSLPEIETLLAVLAGNPAATQTGVQPVEKLPVNNALGSGVGKMLNGKKTALGVFGLLGTFVLPVIFPQLAPVKAVLDSIGMDGAASAAEPGKSILTPLFAALSTWGVLGKFEKWTAALSRAK